MEDMHNMQGHEMSPPEEGGATHNMMVVGEKSVFLSHLPMFMEPHDYQLIMEATFTSGGKDVQALYTKDRQSHPKVRMYTLEPQEIFTLASFFTPPAKPKRTAFKGTVFRGHLERGGREIKGLINIDVNIKRVVYVQKFTTDLARFDKLSYVLFGKGQELFLAHLISEAPDFDQLLSVKISNAPPDENLKRGIRVLFPDRENSAAQRIKEKEKVVGQGQVTGARNSLRLQIEGNVEYYLEEDELS